MARKYGKRSNQGMRNLRSAGWDAAKFTGRTTEKAAVGLARWATTDHSGMGKALSKMPSMGFLDSISYIFSAFFYGIWLILLRAVVVTFTYVIWIPFLIYLFFYY